MKKASCGLPLNGGSRPNFSAWNASLSLPNLGRLEGLRPGHLSLQLPVLRRYLQGLRSCSLNHDLEILPFGDTTEVSGRRASPSPVVTEPLSRCSGVPSLPPWVGRGGTLALPS